MLHASTLCVTAVACTRTDRRPRPYRPGLDGAATVASSPPCTVSSPGHAPHSPLRITQRHPAHSGVRSAAGPAHPCTRCLRSPCPRRAWGPCLACAACAVASGWTLCMLIAINIVHRTHHATMRMSMLALAHRAQTPSIGAHGARRPLQATRLCCEDPSACGPGSIRHARTSHSTLYTHGHGEGRGTCMQNAQQGEHEGQGGARNWQRLGKDRRCWASRDGGVLAVVRQQLQATPCWTAWSRAVHGQTQRKGRGAAGRTLARLLSRPLCRVDGAGQGQGEGADRHRLGVRDTSSLRSTRSAC